MEVLPRGIEGIHHFSEEIGWDGPGDEAIFASIAFVEASVSMSWFFVLGESEEVASIAQRLSQGEARAFWEIVSGEQMGNCFEFRADGLFLRERVIGREFSRVEPASFFEMEGAQEADVRPKQDGPGVAEGLCLCNFASFATLIEHEVDLFGSDGIEEASMEVFRELREG